MQVETKHYNLDDIKCSNGSRFESKLDECINSIINKEGYISCDVSKKAISADGGNYLGTLYEIDVKGKTSEGNKETAIFVKTMATDVETMELISIPDVYKTELFVYKELNKIFIELQDEANIPDHLRLRAVKSYEESYDEAIIMENLTRKGFKTPFRMDVVTLEMAEECVRQLARLHGLSFALEHKRRDYFVTKIKNIKASYKFDNNMWKAYVEKFLKMGLTCLDVDVASKIEKKMTGILKKMEEYVTDQSIMYCMCHGDYRPNNIMIKEVDGKLAEVIPVDYQLIYYGCPIFDFLYFIYMSTDRQFRKAHMIHLKNLYYKSLDDFLQYFDMSSETVFPRKIFENLYEEKLDYGLIIAFLYIPFLFVAEDNEIPDITKQAIVDIDFKFDGKFKDRLKDTVDEFIELGYL